MRRPTSTISSAAQGSIAGYTVYTLCQSGTRERDSIVPLVYVCEAADEADAERIHRIVWNQNVVPFVIIVSPRTIRLHSGFRYERPADDVDQMASGILRVATETADALRVLDAFRAERIDDGSFWDDWGDQVTPETRVDWKLLSALNHLDAWLRGNGLDAPEASHALIGKYVYLSYLRHRGILSDRKLAKWNVRADQVFSRNATVSAFTQVVGMLDEWLNGSMFPLAPSGAGQPKQDHIRKVAGTFSGDDPASEQLALGFDIYDFSFIPIETLSVVYEQFLHAPRADGTSSPGRAQGAYYTPIPLVNFMLEELGTLRPFEQGMRVLDPACGSGAFLVQCYRRIIEQDEEFRPGAAMRPARLRELLQRHIFGIDRDGDACRVAELSLSLTLLDYVDPPDLETTPGFRLPELHGSNIFQGDFFDSNGNWRDILSGMRFDWIVGNPPWIELKRGRVRDADQHAWAWMQDRANQQQFPVGGNQVAEAFSWEVTKYLAEDGIVALLLPAMTLFKDESRSYRERFFSTLNVHAVANFANLAYVLFPGHRYTSAGRIVISRPQRPAAAFFYSQGARREPATGMSVFSPLVVDQRANLPSRPGKRKDTWNIVINANQLRRLDVDEVSDGSPLPWKTAMWGSQLDLRLLRSVTSRFESLDKFCALHGLAISEGLQLRSNSSSEPKDPLPDLVGKLELKTKLLRKLRQLFEFPNDALKEIPAEKCFVRRGRGILPLRICQPPHVIVDKLRRFAVYSDEFIVVPPRQVGISGEESQSELLKALSLYLVSDFAIYHQFLMSPQWGISTSISTLDTLRALPIPLAGQSDAQLATWVQLHRDIVKASRSTRKRHALSLFVEGDGNDGDLPDLLRRLNDLVFDLLQLREYERVLVKDLVHLRMQLIKGKVTSDVVRPTTPEELLRYAITLRDELDAFVEDQQHLAHSVTVVHDKLAVMLAVTLDDGANQQIPPTVRRATSEMAAAFEHIRSRVREQCRQWIYFERNLRIYEGRSTYLFKPQQHLYWMPAQALLDAAAILADTLSLAQEA